MPIYSVFRKLQKGVTSLFVIVFNLSDSISLSLFNQQYIEMTTATEGIQSEKYESALQSTRIGTHDEGIDKVMDEKDPDAIIAPIGSPASIVDHVNGDRFQLRSLFPDSWTGYPRITPFMGLVEQLHIDILFFGRACI